MAVTARRALAGLARAASLAALAAPAAVLHAQTASAPGSAMVTLRLRPRAGDTLHLRFEQTVSGAATASKPTRLLSSMTVISRSVVESSDASGSVVVAHTDSVELRMPGAPSEALARARKGMQGRATRMRVAPDGAMRWLPEGGTGGRAGAEAAAGASTGTALGLPGALPAMPVGVGATWTRTMPLPWAEGTPPRAEAEAPRLEVVFRLDSVGRGGTLAFVSMRGRLLATRSAPVRVGGAAVDGGTAAGQLRLDLGRGWIVDSRVDFALDLVPPSAARAAPGAPPAPPMRVVVSQRLVAR